VLWLGLVGYVPSCLVQVGLQRRGLLPQDLEQGLLQLQLQAPRSEPELEQHQALGQEQGRLQ
jgi:hypothetical protein